MARWDHLSSPEAPPSRSGGSGPTLVPPVARTPSWRVFRSLATTLSVVLVCTAAAGVPASAAVAPTVKGADVEVAEAAADRRVAVVLRLNRASKRSVTVSWRTVAGTAKPGQDYKKPGPAR